MASNIPSAARDPAVPSADGTCDFYNLPRELRDEVYSFAFAGQRVMLAPAVGAVIGRPVYHTVSKQWHQEAMPIFLRQVTAVIGLRSQLKKCIEAAERKNNIADMVLVLPCGDLRCDNSCGSAYRLPQYNGTKRLENWITDTRNEAAGLAEILTPCARLKCLAVQTHCGWINAFRKWVQEAEHAPHTQGLMYLINELLIQLELLEGVSVTFRRSIHKDDTYDTAHDEILRDDVRVLEKHFNKSSASPRT